jgi:peptide/nickel transport system substrate-binding protein
MEEVTAPDPQTVVIRWKSTYRDANRLNEEFPPLPRHLLEQPFQTQVATFTNLPFWSTEYVGAGPYRLDRWESGTFIEATAFDRHPLGQPTIGRIRILFIPDANAGLAQLLSGDVHATVDDVIRFQQAAILRKEWTPRNGGTVLSIPDQWRRTEIQHRPEYANPRAILDPRVRRALAYGLDRQALVEALFEGEGIVADSPVPTTVDYFPAIRSQLVSYTYEPRRTEQLMTEAGFTRGADGVYASPTEGRLSWELKVNIGTQAETEMAIMAAGWRQLGFDFREATLPAAQSRDGQIRGTFPTLFTGGGITGDDQFINFTSPRIPNADNRWVGNNRGGWSNPDYDRLAEQFNVALDRSERGRLVAQMIRFFNDDVAALSLYYNPGMVAFTSAIEGPRLSAPEPLRTWNIQEWRWK